jgi:hypothetical protein
VIKSHFYARRATSVGVGLCLMFWSFVACVWSRCKHFHLHLPEWDQFMVSTLSAFRSFLASHGGAEASTRDRVASVLSDHGLDSSFHGRASTDPHVVAAMGLGASPSHKLVVVGTWTELSPRAQRHGIFFPASHDVIRVHRGVRASCRCSP